MGRVGRWQVVVRRFAVFGGEKEACERERERDSFVIGGGGWKMDPLDTFWTPETRFWKVPVIVRCRPNRIAEAMTAGFYFLFAGFPCTVTIWRVSHTSHILHQQAVMG